MRNKLVVEELNRIRLLMGYKLNDTLNENYNRIGKMPLINEGIGDALIKRELEVIGKSLSKSELNVAAKNVFKEAEALSKAQGTELKLTMKDANGELKTIKTADELASAFKAGTAGPEAVGLMAKDILKTSENTVAREASTKLIAGADGFAATHAGKTRTKLIEDLQLKGYSKEEAELLAKEFEEINAGRFKSTDEVIKTGDDAIKTGDDAIKTGDDAIKTGDDAIKTGDDAIKTGDDAIKTGEGKTGQEVLDDAIKKTDDELKNLKAKEQDLLQSELKKQQAKLDKQIAKNERQAARDARKAMEESKAAGEEYLKRNGFLSWNGKLAKWTIRNKYFWFLVGGSALAYYFWDDILDVLGIGREDDGTPEPNLDNGNSGGDEDSGAGDNTNNTDLINWQNDPNAGDGEPGDPLLGSYKICGAKVKLGCRDGSSDKIWRLQKCLYIKATGYWGNKTEEAARGMFDDQQLSNGIDVAQIKERCIY